MNIPLILSPVASVHEAEYFKHNFMALAAVPFCFVYPLGRTQLQEIRPPTVPWPTSLYGGAEPTLRFVEARSSFVPTRGGSKVERLVPLILAAMAIRAVLIFNNHGKPRLTRFYAQLPTSRQQALLQKTFSLVHRRTIDKSGGREVCNFLDAPELRPLLPPSTTGTTKKTSSDRLDPYDEDVDACPQPAARTASKKKSTASDQLRVIYRHYATLYFVFIVDESESELGILDLIQVFVEALDRIFESVCELDLIFHFDQVHFVLDEIVQGGSVLETNLSHIVKSAQQATRARKTSASAQTAAGALGIPSNTAWTTSAGEWAREWGSRLTGGMPS